MSNEVLAAIIAAVAPTSAVLLTWRHSRNKLKHIHILVNARLDHALRQIEQLDKELEAWRKLHPEDVAPPTSRRHKLQEGGEP